MSTKTATHKEVVDDLRQHLRLGRIVTSTCSCGSEMELRTECDLVFWELRHRDCVSVGPDGQT